MTMFSLLQCVQICLNVTEITKITNLLIHWSDSILMEKQNWSESHINLINQRLDLVFVQRSLFKTWSVISLDFSKASQKWPNITSQAFLCLISVTKFTSYNVGPLTSEGTVFGSVHPDIIASDLIDNCLNQTFCFCAVLWFWMGRSMPQEAP